MGETSRKREEIKSTQKSPQNFAKGVNEQHARLGDINHDLDIINKILSTSKVFVLVC